MRLRNYNSIGLGQKSWTKEEILFLEKHYKQCDCFELSLSLKRSQDSVRGKLRSLGLKQKKAQRLQTKVNHDFFKKWSEHMAYVLGYWFADGYMSSKDYYFSIASKDKDHLQLILNSMESDHKINHSGKGIFSFSVGSKTIWDDVFELGGTPHKSLTILPPSVPRRFIRHFIRGYFDGDGCVYIGKRGIGMGCRGTFEMMSYIKEHLPTKIGLYQEKRYKLANKNHWFLSKQGKKCIDNLQFMYNYSNISLFRKKEKYKLCQTV